MSESTLSFTDHRRDNLRRTYVYTVVSRRSRGVSIGINLSVTNQCNWRCIYCQVPNLSRGGTPAADIDQLKRELDDVLNELVDGDWMERNVPEGLRRINDIAFSGNGEPTACPNFADAVEAAGESLRSRGLDDVNVVVITNGSYLGKATTRDALSVLNRYNGEIWAKLDGGTAETIERINDYRMPVERHLQNIADASRIVRTKVQSCFIHLPGLNREQADADYLAALDGLLEHDAEIAEVQVYTMARVSHQSDEPSALSNDEVDAIADAIETKGFATSRAYAPS